MTYITDNILPGSINHPLFATIINPPNIAYFNEQVASLPKNLWKISLWCPLISTVTGCALALLAIIHTIIHLSSAIFDADHWSYHWKEIKIGISNIPDGMIALLPILGNIALFIKDLWNLSIENKHAKQYIIEHPEECEDNILLLYDGQKVGQASLWRMQKLIQKNKFKLRLELNNSPFKAIESLLIGSTRETAL